MKGTLIREFKYRIISHRPANSLEENSEEDRQRKMLDNQILRTWVLMGFGEWSSYTGSRFQEGRQKIEKMFPVFAIKIRRYIKENCPLYIPRLLKP